MEKQPLLSTPPASRKNSNPKTETTIKHEVASAFLPTGRQALPTESNLEVSNPLPSKKQLKYFAVVVTSTQLCRYFKEHIGSSVLDVKDLPKIPRRSTSVPRQPSYKMALLNKLNN
jgi:hypothetical protein